MINKLRLEKNLKDLGTIGWIEGKGLDREAYSEAYFEAREFVRSLMIEAGMNVRTDRVGNLFGRLEGMDKDSKTILTGSHLDAAKEGGIYDGAAGVLASIEAMRSIIESGAKLRHSVEVAAFIAEEGGELGGTFGSRAFTGNSLGKVRPEVLQKYGLNTEDVYGSKGRIEEYKAYMELHIEQGPVLWKSNINIGIPTSIVGITRYKVVIEGKANHAGTTPMAERRDAFREAAALINRWYEYVDREEGFVCNIGDITIRPGSIAIVPEKAEFVLELRSGDDETTKRAAEKFQEILGSGSIKFSKNMILLVEKPAVRLDKNIIDCIETACNKLQMSYIKMPSGASHDASPIAHVMPTGMIFVPSIRGISHSKDEYTPLDDIYNGVEVLKSSIMQMDEI